MNADQRLENVENRLNRLEALAETTLLAVRDLAGQHRNQQQAIERLTQEIRDLAEETTTWFVGVVEQADQDRAEIRRLSEDASRDRSLIVGLQTEAHRIWERLEQQGNT